MTVNSVENCICAVIVGGEECSLEGARSADFVIAVDRGLDYALNQKLSIDLAIGDFDSFQGTVPQYIRTQKLPSVKDDTDTLAALKQGISLGFRHFNIYCAFGKRLDHLLSNFQAFTYAASSGVNVVAYSDDDEMYLIHGSGEYVERSFNPRAGWALSVFSLSDRSHGVTISNAAYEVVDGELSREFPIGTSNEFLPNEQLRVGVRSGTLAVIISRLR